MHLSSSFIPLLFSFSVAGWPFDSIWRLQQQPGSSHQHVLDKDEKGLGYPRRPASPSSILKHYGSHPSVGFVALGDSYGAGIGTGFEGKEDDCRHGLGAYPHLIASDMESHHGGPNSTSFQFLSCTGSTTNEVLSGGDVSQIDSLNASLPTDFALLSLGGNDLGFFEIMNACVFRFYNFYSGTCETALEHGLQNLESPDFEIRMLVVITEILNKVRWEKKPDFRITVTGYARFFNDATDECDEMSLGVWWRGPKLKRELRTRMNAMVQAVNRKIEKTVDEINSMFLTPRVLFVDYDDEFEGHRFCEPGVEEPAYDRAETYFFLVGGLDNARNSTNISVHTQEMRRADATALPRSMAHLANPDACLEPAQRSGDWGELALCYMAMSRAEDPFLRPAHDGLFGEESMWYVPTYYGKTFHPRTLGHEVIRDQIYTTWDKVQL
jgi:hypothetical protein